MADEVHKPRLVGVNHVALEVGDLDAALDFYARVFDFELRGRIPGMAFLDMGDQFLALSEGRSGPPDADRHFGLVVDDKEAARRRLAAEGLDVRPSGGLDFRDPWGNFVQVVDYREIQFMKTGEILRILGLDGMEKTGEALRELREKGIEP
jgi:catechol 2,3-dioxygenase-like lactoylglutathione lyase family enzyme